MTGTVLASDRLIFDERSARHPGRDGSHPLSWHGELRAGEDRDPKPGWPS